MPIDLLVKYFPNLSDIQKDRFKKMEMLYAEWNSKINVVSRNDISNLTERHILHSLSIAKIFSFEPGTQIIDVGTGGGFPGIPLAVMFEDCYFTLIDSIGKKIKVVQEISGSLGLKNVYALQERSAKYKAKFDYVVSRAVTNLPSFINQTKHLIDKGKGIIYLKGGDFDEELKRIKGNVKIFDISAFYKEEFYETKKMIYVAFKASSKSHKSL